jgi:hypothetical protein
VRCERRHHRRVEALMGAFNTGRGVPAVSVLLNGGGASARFGRCFAT